MIETCSSEKEDSEENEEIDERERAVVLFDTQLAFWKFNFKGEGGRERDIGYMWEVEAEVGRVWVEEVREVELEIDRDDLGILN